VHEPSSLALPNKPVSSWRMILHLYFPLALSVDQIFGYFLNLLFSFFSRHHYILLWFCSFKLSAFGGGGTVNFSKHCLTVDLSSSTKHKEETEYRVWILFTKPRGGFPPAMSPYVPSASWTHRQGFARGSERSSPASRGSTS